MNLNSLSPPLCTLNSVYYAEGLVTQPRAEFEQCVMNMAALLYLRRAASAPPGGPCAVFMGRLQYPPRRGRMQNKVPTILYLGTCHVAPRLEVHDTCTI